MNFKTVRIHFISDVFGCCHPEILLPWQCGVTTSPPRENARVFFPPGTVQTVGDTVYGVSVLLSGCSKSGV